jgi:hypothetical protein
MLPGVAMAETLGKIVLGDRYSAMARVVMRAKIRMMPLAFPGETKFFSLLLK